MSDHQEMKPILRFGDCTLAKLEKKFQLEQVPALATLSHWLSLPGDMSDLERQILLIFQDRLILNVHDWNEIELLQGFIGPVFMLVNFTAKKFNLFSERAISGLIEGVELRGEPDGMIASGMREPELPYFCFQEYTPLVVPPESGGREGGNRDAAGQCLAAMLVAQALNETKYPVYGCYVIGHDWYFMVLQGREYAISHAYVATRDDIFDIFRILKALKQIITELVG